MKILALEFSSTQRSVAIFDSKADAVMASISELGGRSTRAFSLIEQALAQATLKREEIECVAIGIGPGSYTGIRAAISIAQGWQLAREIKICGVSSVEAIAAGIQARGTHGKVNVVVDAQRNEFYVARYEISAQAVGEIEALHIVSADEIRKRIDTGEKVVGPDLDGFAGSELVYPEASIVAMLAGKGSNFISSDKLEPIYLRETTFIKAPPARIIS